MLKVKFDEAAFDREVRRVADEIARDTQRAASQAAMVGQMKAREYLMAFIYQQPAGVRPRTEVALKSLGMSLMPSGEGFLLTLRSDAEYASQLELGNELDYFEQQQSSGHLPMISVQELDMLLENMGELNNGDPDPTSLFARRGAHNYQEPAPHITPAAIAAVYDFMARLEALYRKQGR